MTESDIDYTPEQIALLQDLYNEGVAIRHARQLGEYATALNQGHLGKEGTPLEDHFSESEIAELQVLYDKAEAVEWNGAIDVHLERRRLGYMQLDGSRDSIVPQNVFSTWARTRLGGFDGWILILGAAVNADGQKMRVGLTNECRLRVEVKPEPLIEPAGPLGEAIGPILPGILRPTKLVSVDYPNHPFNGKDLKVEGWAPVPPGFTIVPGVWRTPEVGIDLQGASDWRSRDMVFEPATDDPDLEDGGSTALSKIINLRLSQLRPTGWLEVRNKIEEVSKKAIQLVKRKENE